MPYVLLCRPPSPLHLWHQVPYRPLSAFTHELQLILQGVRKIWRRSKWPAWTLKISVAWKAKWLRNGPRLKRDEKKEKNERERERDERALRMSAVMSGSQGEFEKQKQPPEMFWGQMGKFEYTKYLILLCKESTCQFRRHRFHPWIGKVPWKRKWQPTPVFLPGKSHGQRSLAGYSPWGCETAGHDLATKQQQIMSMVNFLKVTYLVSQIICTKVLWDKVSFSECTDWRI